MYFTYLQILLVEIHSISFEISIKYNLAIYNAYILMCFFFRPFKQKILTTHKG